MEILMIFNMNEFLISMSYVIDFIEKDIIYNSHNHGKKVAYIAACIGLHLEFTNEDLFDLMSNALLHDNGMAKGLVLVNNDLHLSEGSNAHCLQGELNLADFPFVKKRENVILYHHEWYDGTGHYGAKGDELPLFTRIITLADEIAQQQSRNKIPSECIRFASEKSGTMFDPFLVDIFTEIAKNSEFWFKMDDNYINQELLSLMPTIQAEYTYKELRSITRIFQTIIDTKSPFTGEHSKGISEKVGILCNYYNYDSDTYWKMRIAADLHDLGKLIIPSRIIDKPAKLTKEEFQIIMTHPYQTRKALENIKGFEDITNWAANHHEKLDGSGYPFGLNKDQLDKNSRILSCVDIYQALTETRPYRKGMSHEMAISIMDNMVERDFIDSTIVRDIDFVFSKKDIQQQKHSLCFMNN